MANLIFIVNYDNLFTLKVNNNKNLTPPPQRTRLLPFHGIKSYNPVYKQLRHAGVSRHFKHQLIS